jgi:X-X-X-Leu-X-X-Gly heptad repeat protein
VSDLDWPTYRAAMAALAAQRTAASDYQRVLDLQTRAARAGDLERVLALAAHLDAIIAALETASRTLAPVAARLAHAPLAGPRAREVRAGLSGMADQAAQIQSGVRQLAEWLSSQRSVLADALAALASAAEAETVPSRSPAQAAPLGSGAP